MQKILVVDSSTLIALERVNLIPKIDKIGFLVVITKAVNEEIGKNSKSIFKNIKVRAIKGKSHALARQLMNLGIGKGEAESCALAHSLKLGFFICDDQKFLRQRFFSNNEELNTIAILGFSFILDLMVKKKIIKDIWKWFYKIIVANHWERSEVLVANYVYLKERGY